MEGVPQEHPSPRIGLWGAFDVENFGDALFPHVARRELGRRLPGVEIRAFGLFGQDHPTRFDAGPPLEALGAYGPQRVAELAEQLDCVLVGGGDIVHTRDELWARSYGVAADEIARVGPGRFFIDGLGPELEEECPVVWHCVGLPFDIDPAEAPRYREALARRPHVAVRDDASARRLRQVGVEREIVVVPDPTLLLPRVFTEEDLARRLAYLRTIGAYPAERPALVVQGSRSLLPAVGDLAAAVSRVAEERSAEVVLVETGPCHGDGEFAEAMTKRLTGPTRRAENAGLLDVVAAISASEGFVGASLRGSIAALVYGRPHVMVALDRETSLADFARLVDRPESLAEAPDEIPAAFDKMATLGPRPELVQELQARVDTHFDAVAEIAALAARRRAGARTEAGSHARIEALRAAFEERGRRLAIQRWRMAERVEAAEDRARDLAGEVGRLEAERRRLEAEVAGKEGELRRLLATRTFRYTAGLRRAYARLRSVFRR